MEPLVKVETWIPSQGPDNNTQSARTGCSLIHPTQLEKRKRKEKKKSQNFLPAAPCDTRGGRKDKLRIQIYQILRFFLFFRFIIKAGKPYSCHVPVPWASPHGEVPKDHNLPNPGTQVHHNLLD